MGFVREPKVYNLVWEAGEFAGLEVKAKAASVATYRHIAEMATHEFSWPPTEADLIRVDELHQAFGAVLMSWNLELADGTAVPATVDGLRSQDPELSLAIILAWMNAVVGQSTVEHATEEDLAALVGSLPMDVLTPAP